MKSPPPHPPAPQSQEISDFSITQSPCQLPFYSWKPRVNGMCVEGGKGRGIYTGANSTVSKPHPSQPSKVTGVINYWNELRGLDVRSDIWLFSLGVSTLPPPPPPLKPVPP